MSCIKTFLELQKQRKTGRTKSLKKDQKTKLTRRLYVGWKHSIRAEVYKLISASKGGVQQIVDFNKDLTLDQLIWEIITDIFFSKWDVGAPGFKTGCLRCASGILFWLPNSRDRREWGVFYSWKLFKKMKSTPVRIYLHTELVSYKNF